MDLMASAMECSKLRFDFNNKIAILSPDIEERIRFAERFKACIEAQGFEFRPFFEYESAIDWLTMEE